MKINLFWQGVPNHPQVSNPKRIVAASLEEAIQIVAVSESIETSLRRNREVIDLHNNFRHFTFQEKTYVLKKTKHKKGLKEIENAMKAFSRLQHLKLEDGWSIEVVVPTLFQIDEKSSVLMSADYGITLHQMLLEEDFQFPGPLFFDILSKLIKAGIYWIGFVPRNIFLDSKLKILRFIDWEEAYFYSPDQSSFLDPLFLLKLTINWKNFVHSNSFNDDLLLIFEKKGAGLTERDLDGFEKAYKKINPFLISDEKIRDLCSEATIKSEGFIQQQNTKKELTPFEVGHLIDDLLPSNMSVFFTFATAKIRSTVSGGEYKSFLNSIISGMQNIVGFDINAFDIKRPEIIRFIIKMVFVAHEAHADNKWSSVMFSPLNPRDFQSSNFCAWIDVYEKIKDAKGLNIGYQRAACLEKLLWVVFSAMISVFNIQEKLDLLIRGSLGQGVLSCKSDVDFEISCPSFPDGCEGLENLLVEILGYFDIQCEASKMRPLEKDLISADGLSRDLHEWMQLRKPLSVMHDPGYWANVFPPLTQEIWKCESIYESSANKNSAKYSFFAVRDIIARLAFYNGFNLATTREQLLKIGKINGVLGKKLEELLIKSLHLYENDISDIEVFKSIDEQLQKFKKDMSLRAPV